jgi:hypothetical protein
MANETVPMKKIGILNFQYSTNNYGAVLQAAALEHICRQLGHDPKHLDFMARPKVSLKGRVGQLLRKMKLRKTSKANQIANEEVFESFRQNFINRTESINSASGFSEVAKSFDSVIVGSDQVWRPTFAKDPIAFFLGYVPKGINRIAYAASFGTAVWERADDAILTAKVRGELSKFKAISCREESGVEICKSVFGVEAVHVLDPLLLVDDSFFEKLLAQSSVKREGELVYYKLDFSEDFQNDLKAIGTTLETNVVNLYHRESDDPEYREVTDWLALIINSKVVITDSFHCICLALRFGKEIIYCPNEKRGKTRLDSLFKKSHVDVVPLDVKLKTPMFKLSRRGDFDTALGVERLKSMKFLTGALSE